MKSPKWLRRMALPIALLGVLHILAAWPVWKIALATLPLQTALAGLFLYLATGLWVVASGFVLGFLAEADRVGEEWAAPFARGVTNFLLAGAFLACALVWNNPIAWIFGFLALLARLFARKADALIPKSESTGSPTPKA